MTRTLRYLAIGLVAATAAVAGYLTRQATPLGSAPEVAKSEPMNGETLFAITLPDTKGASRTLSEWRGKVMVVNFWATWCPPCLKEIPDFAEVSKRHANDPVQFVGIGIDSPAKIVEFEQEHQVPYPLLLGSTQTLALAADLAGTAQAMPLTFILDRTGAVHHVRLGTLNQDELEGTIRALLAP